MKSEWNKNWMKLTADILFVYTQDDIFGIINNAKGKHPTPG